MKETPFTLKRGQLVIGCVLASGTSEYNQNSSGNKNRKLQLSIDPMWINRGIESTKVTPGMLL